MLQATTLLEWLEERNPGRFAPDQLRTLQATARESRALYGPAREVYFEQEAEPGRARRSSTSPTRCPICHGTPDSSDLDAGYHESA